MILSNLVLVCGISALLLAGCSKEDANRVLYQENIDLYGKNYLVEVRGLEKGQVRRLWIYDMGVDRTPGTTSEWAGISFARDDDGDGKIDSLKGPILGLVYSIDKSKSITISNDQKNVMNKLERVLNNSENKHG